jgi:hypothetical protein
MLRSPLIGELCLCLITWAPGVTHCRGRRMLVALTQGLNLLDGGLDRLVRLVDLLTRGLGRPLCLIDLIEGGDLVVRSASHTCSVGDLVIHPT